MNSILCFSSLKTSTSNFYSRILFSSTHSYYCLYTYNCKLSYTNNRFDPICIDDFDRFKALINDKSTLPRYMFTAVKTLKKYKRQIKNTMYYNGLSNGPLEGINNKIKVIKRISYGYRFFTNFKAKILLVFSLFTPSVTNKKPIYSKEERQAILTKKKEIRLKRKNRKKAILLNIA